MNTNTGANISGGFPFPPQWQQAGNIFSQFARGLPTGIPQPWATGMGYAGEAAQTGLPTDIGDWWQSQQQFAKQNISDAVKQAAEQAGMTGTRWSTPFQRQASDIGARAMTSILPEYWKMGAGMQEAAAGRRMEALPLLYQYGAGMAGLSESAKDRAMSAASQLMPLGQMYANLPMDVAGTMTGLGGQLQQQRMAEFMPYLQEFLRMSPEASPWLQLAFQGTQMPYGLQQQFFQPSFLSQLLGTGSSLAGILSALGLFGGSTAASPGANVPGGGW